MNILPEKELNSILCRFCPYDYQNNGMCPITEMCERRDMYRREISNLCQQAVDKAVGEAADVDEIIKVLNEAHYHIVNRTLAMAISTHIKRAFGKEYEE